MFFCSFAVGRAPSAPVVEFAHAPTIRQPLGIAPTVDGASFLQPYSFFRLGTDLVA